MPKGIPLDPPVDKKVYLRNYYLANKEKYQETPEKRARRLATAATSERRAKRAAEYQRDFAKNKTKRDANVQAWYARNADRVKDNNLRREFGIGLQEWRDMHQSQGLKCAICRMDGFRRWNTDHCHATGKVRGILCHWCNLLLGNAKDNTEILKRSIEYLENAAK